MGRKPKVAIVPEGPSFPEPLEYIWQHFCEIAFGLPINGFAPSPVTWSALCDWSALTGTPLEPWEARALVMLGAARVAALTKETQKPAGPAPPGSHGKR